MENNRMLNALCQAVKDRSKSLDGEISRLQAQKDDLDARSRKLVAQITQKLADKKVFTEATIQRFFAAWVGLRHNAAIPCPFCFAHDIDSPLSDASIDTEERLRCAACDELFRLPQEDE